MAGFEFFVENLRNFGFYNFLLPMLLVFAVVYGILEYVKAFGDNKGVNLIISLCVSLLVLGGIYTFIPADFFTIFFSRFAVVLVALLAIAILMGFFNIKLEDLMSTDKKTAKWIIFVILAILIITMIVFLVFNISMTASSVGTAFGSFFSSEAFLSVFGIAIMLGVIVLVIWLVTKNGGGDSP